MPLVSHMMHSQSSHPSQIPWQVQKRIARMVEETEKCNGLTMNICISYGSRGEIVAATRSIVAGVVRGELDASHIDEMEFEKRLLTSHCGDPDVLIRTSGEIRISNFLLWQLAYTEMFFVDKPWPAMEKEDLLNVIRTFAKGRKRRFGK
jgi:undecaprenyl diphosphate synthase